jgi:hypothetical protein
MKRLTIAVAAFAGLFLGSPAGAETKAALTASEVMSALAEAGLSPQLSSDAATGAPVFLGRSGDIVFIVRALDCAGAPPACENFLFIANFDLGRPVSEEDYRVINRFNDSQLFGRAYVLPSQSQVGVEYVIELGGGVSREHVTQNIARWSQIVGAFIGNFRKGPAS